MQNLASVNCRPVTATPETNRPITLFVQCLVDSLYPEVKDSVEKIFLRLGLDVVCPKDQTCCGQPAFNSGYRKEARVAAARFIEIFGDAETIVCPSGSCVNMVRHHYPLLFENDPKYYPKAVDLGRRIFELTEFLIDVLRVEDLGAAFAGKVTYHDSCHLLRGISVRSQPRRLIQNVKGATLVEMKDSDRCCGFGGSFFLKYPDISAAMAADKVNAIINSGADVVVGCDMGCLMRIQKHLICLGSDIQVLHIAQLLTMA
ncbi:MAG: (Fe-S)-binding protein [Deltaproteobacteria bacterium]|nr:(Fe-S)-binding protein [Deltaproteobacteria bacterium]